MEPPAQLMLLYLVALSIIVVLVYLALNQKQKRVKVVSPKHASFQTHWWGYGWRPWWRRYNGVPGVM